MIKSSSIKLILKEILSQKDSNISETMTIYETLLRFLQKHLKI